MFANDTDNSIRRRIRIISILQPQRNICFTRDINAQKQTNYNTIAQANIQQSKLQTSFDVKSLIARRESVLQNLSMLHFFYL